MIRRSLVLLSVAAALTGCSSFKSAFTGYSLRADADAARAVDAGRRFEGTPRDAPRYVAMAGAGDQFEIQSSQVALQRSRNPDVRRVAEMMIADHARTSTIVADGVARAGLPAAAPRLDAVQAGMLAQLAEAPNGVMFDRLYLRQQLSAHQQALNLHSGYAYDGDVPALRVSARQVVRIVRGHLGDLTRLQSVPLV